MSDITLLEDRLEAIRVENQRLADRVVAMLEEQNLFLTRVEHAFEEGKANPKLDWLKSRMYAELKAEGWRV